MTPQTLEAKYSIHWWKTDEILGVFSVFEEFEAHKKTAAMNMKKYASDFEVKYKAAKNNYHKNI